MELDPLDEAIYLIEVNETVKEYLSKCKPSKSIGFWLSKNSVLKLEIETGVAIQVPEGTAFDDIKDVKKEALLTFFMKRPWILLPYRESPIPRITQILRALLHYSGQPFFITSEGDIQPILQPVQ